MRATGHNMYDPKAFFWRASLLMGFVGLGSCAILALRILHVKIVKITVSLWSVCTSVPTPFQSDGNFGVWVLHSPLQCTDSDFRLNTLIWNRTAHVPLSQLAWRHIVRLSVDAWCVMVGVIWCVLVWSCLNLGLWLAQSCKGSCFWRASWKLSSSADGLGRAKVVQVREEI